MVIISAVRSNKNKQIGFLDDEKRLNVSITRARLGLIIIGNAECLSVDPNWSALIKNYANRGLLVEDCSSSGASDFCFRGFSPIINPSLTYQPEIGAQLQSEYSLTFR